MFEEDDFDEELDELEEKTPAIASKTPAAKPSVAGKKVNLFFTSTIGPGEKKEKLLVDTGNQVGAIKTTVGNLFGLNPSDFHLSYGGVTLDETSPLEEYNVSDGDTVLLIPASTAG
ncbi:MAG: ubiquitin-like domain-containing protein [Candidatus Helarchaeota archaeon]